MICCQCGVLTACSHSLFIAGSLVIGKAVLHGSKVGPGQGYTQSAQTENVRPAGGWIAVRILCLSEPGHFRTQAGEDFRNPTV